MVEALGADHGGAVLFDSAQQTGRLIIEYPRREQAPINVVVSLVNPLFTAIRTALQPAIMADTATDENFQYGKELLNGREDQSLLIVPVLGGAQFIVTI